MFSSNFPLFSSNFRFSGIVQPKEEEPSLDCGQCGVRTRKRAELTCKSCNVSFCSGCADLTHTKNPCLHGNKHDYGALHDDSLMRSESAVDSIPFHKHFDLSPLTKSKVILSSAQLSLCQKLGKEWDSRITPLFLRKKSCPKGREKKKLFHSVGTYLQNVILILSSNHRVLPEFNGSTDPSWETIALQFWKGSSHWAEILFLTEIFQGVYKRKTVPKSQCLLLKDLVSAFVDSFKSFSKELKSQQTMVERISFDLIAYLSTHSLDPFNLFLGACPSESFSSSFQTIDSTSTSTIPSDSPDSQCASPFRTAPLSLVTESASISPLSSSFTDSEQFLSSSPSPYLNSSSSVPLLLPPAMKMDNTNTEEKENESPNVILGGEQIESSYLDLVMRWSNFLNHPDQILKEISVVAENIQKSQCWGTGCLVAVEVDALPPCQRKWFTNPNWKKVWDCRFVFCRIASHHLFKDHGGSVEIFLDPLERESLRVVASSVFTFDQKELEEELTVFNRKWFSRPSDFFFNRCVEIIEEAVEKFLCTDPNTKNSVRARDLFHIEEAFKEYKLRMSLVGSEFKSRILNHLLGETKEFFEEWVADVPLGLVCPPRHKFYGYLIDKLLKSFPEMVSQEIESHMTFSKTRLQNPTQRLQMVINGTRKNDVCGWWLNHIQDETDRFLKKRGFDLEALPPDYTDTPPKDISIVERNQQILMNLLDIDEDNSDRGDDGDDGKRDGESKHSDESLDHFVDETVQRVYEKLDELMSEMEFVLQRGWEFFILDEFRFEYSESDLDSLRKDYEYLKKVKAMDQQIKMEEKKGKEKKRVEMSEVVPVAGLVMARFHIYDCEISTALDLWGQKKKPILQKAESQVAFPAEYLKIAKTNKPSFSKGSSFIAPEVSESEDELSQMRQRMCSFFQDSSESSSIGEEDVDVCGGSGARGILATQLDSTFDFLMDTGKKDDLTGVESSFPTRRREEGFLLYDSFDENPESTEVNSPTLSLQMISQSETSLSSVSADFKKSNPQSFSLTTTRQSPQTQFGSARLSLPPRNSVKRLSLSHQRDSPIQVSIDQQIGELLPSSSNFRRNRSPLWLSSKEKKSET